MSSRTNPFYELERLFERLNRQLDDASRWWGDEPSRPWASTDEPAVDLVEAPDDLVVTVDIPGFDRDDLDVRVSGRTLSIEAERDEATETGDETYLRRERRRRSLRRSLRLPTEVDADGVTATLKHGVLTVTIPKAEPDDEAQHIEIESE